MSLLSLDYAREHFGAQMKDLSFILQLTEELMLRSKRVGYIRGDDVLHVPSAPFGNYVRKIEYRVVNNISNVGLSGYTNVAEKVPKLKRRKYLFALYAVSIILPILHSIYYAVRYRDATYMAHCLYVYVTIFLIVFYMARRSLGIKDKKGVYS